MRSDYAVEVLRKKLSFSPESIKKINEFCKYLLSENKDYNLIGKSTVEHIWERHILDSAQILRFIEADEKKVIADLGTGAGFPGLILAFYDEQSLFHVKLFEKSSVKRNFLLKMVKKFKLNVEILENVYNQEIEANIIVCRAFKKIEEIIKISREKIKKPHKIIILKGKNAQTEIKNVSMSENYSYKLEKSMTSEESKIIIINAKKER